MVSQREVFISFLARVQSCSTGVVGEPKRSHLRGGHMKKRIYERLSRMSGLDEEELMDAAKKPSNFNKRKEEKHRNLDLFVCPSFLSVSPKSDRQSLEHPFFVMSQHKNKGSALVYENETKKGLQRVCITPSFYGAALQSDKDLVIYAVSMLMAEVNKGTRLSENPEIIFGLYDFAIHTNRSIGSVYRDIENILRRLSGTRIETSVKAGGETFTEEWGFITSWKTQKQDAELKGKVSIRLSGYLMNAIRAEEVLTIPRDYFRISGNLKRRLWEVGKKHTGKQKGWVIKMELLHKKVGSTTTLKAFRQAIKKVVADNDLPQYVILYKAEEDKVAFLQRETPKKPKKPKPPPIISAEDEAQRELDRKHRTLN
jgi:hypothetical protein